MFIKYKNFKIYKEKLIQLQGAPENYINIVGYFNIPHPATHKSSRQK